MTDASGIYAILQLSTGRHYVGSAVQLRRRFGRHQYDLAAKRHHNLKLQRAWDKHGQSDFRFDVLEKCSQDALIEREQFWLDQTKPFFNILRQAHSGAGYKHSEETRANMKALAKQRWESMPLEAREALAKAHAQRITGKRAPLKTRLKMSIAKIGRSSTDTQRASFERNKNSPDAIAKRVAKRARWYVVTSPEGRETEIQNMSAFARDNNLSQAHVVAVARGKRPAHKGWLCRYKPEDD